MAVILRGGAVFLHIPKTGGTWVTSVLRDAGLVRCSIGHRHANWPHLLAPGYQGVGRKVEYLYKRSAYLRTSPKPFTFCFVRHPLAWYESFYRYKSQAHLNWERDGDSRDWNRWHPNSILNGLGEGNTFDEFVENVIDAYPGYVSALFSYYTLPPVDFIGKQETLTDDLLTVLEETGQRFDEKAIREAAPVNQSKSAGGGIEWDPGLRERVLALEAAALLRFGYTE